jgi:phospho-N-acetylmuramoyl-pentapeptide-transferase
VGYIILIISFGFVGLLDDVYKVYYKDTFGFRGSKKLIIQLIVAAATVLLMVNQNCDYLNLPIYVPLLNLTIPLGIFSSCFFVLIITGSSNAANITDGLDGLLSMPVILICLTFIAIILLDICGIKALPIKLDRSILFGIIIILSSTATCFLTFLWFNHHPARIFMGDVGSLFVGSVLGYTSVLLKIEFIYALMALWFIWEMTTSVIQVVCFRLTNGKKRVFKMAPFHHHLEKCGWKETKIVFTVWIFCLVCCLLSFTVYYFGL